MGLLLRTSAALTLLATPLWAATEGEGQGEAAAHGGEEVVEHAGGMPQLNFDSYGSQIFWLVVSLVVLFFILKTVALPRIAGGLEERSDAIEDDLDRAAEFRKKAQEAEAAYDKALADARAKAQEIAQKTRDEIQAQVDEAIAKADAEIAAKTAEGEKHIDEIRASALEAVEQVASETAGAVVEAVVPGMADEAAAKAAVAAAMKG